MTRRSTTLGSVTWAFFINISRTLSRPCFTEMSSWNWFTKENTWFRVEIIWLKHVFKKLSHGYSHSPNISQIPRWVREDVKCEMWRLPPRSLAGGDETTAFEGQYSVAQDYDQPGFKSQPCPTSSLCLSTFPDEGNEDNDTHTTTELWGFWDNAETLRAELGME